MKKKAKDGTGATPRRYTAADREAAQLNAWADALLGIGFDAWRAAAKPFSRLPILCPLPDNARIGIAGYLRRVATTPRALKAVAPMNQKAHRGRPPQMARTWKIALDYLLTRERLGKEVLATLEMNQAWGVGRSQILAAYSACQKARGWPEWAAYEVRSARASAPQMSDDKLLLRISRTLRGPGKSRK